MGMDAIPYHGLGMVWYGMVPYHGYGCHSASHAGKEDVPVGREHSYLSSLSSLLVLVIKIRPLFISVR